ncbi:unnamed protein product [Protopolystoma xenopodis]|uniref:Gamma-soluble NSF attachment protein n=1 Tax=Protopolystoma xenopodis TaxID=117903 RepID=A0A448X6P3_9PLAT|nr:unnamed protein product [Protopolystoma xenopodis]
MKTSLLKWKPDLDGAIEYYTKAALIYRNAKKLHEGAELYKKIAHLNLQRGSAFHAAKAFEIASLMHRDAKEFHKMADLVYEAGKLLRESGSPDSATLVYEKASKSLEDYLPERAAEFYESSSEACEAEDKHLQAAEQAGQAARMWTRMRRYNEAERLLRKQISFVLDSSTSQQNMNSITSTAQL